MEKDMKELSEENMEKVTGGQPKMWTAGERKQWEEKQKHEFPDPCTTMTGYTLEEKEKRRKESEDW